MDQRQSTCQILKFSAQSIGNWKERKISHWLKSALVQALSAAEEKATCQLVQTFSPTLVYKKKKKKPTPKSNTFFWSCLVTLRCLGHSFKWSIWLTIARGKNRQYNHLLWTEEKRVFELFVVKYFEVSYWKSEGWRIPVFLTMLAPNCFIYILHMLKWSIYGVS